MGAQCSVVITLTLYVLDGPDIKFRYGRAFFVPDPFCTLGPLTLMYEECLVFYGGKEAGEWCWPPASSNAEVANGLNYNTASLPCPHKYVMGWPSHTGLQTKSLKMKISMHIMKAFCWVEVWIHSFLTSTLREGEWSVSLRGHLTLGWWAGCNRCMGDAVDTRTGWRLWRREKFCTCSESNNDSSD